MFILSFALAPQLRFEEDHVENGMEDEDSSDEDMDPVWQKKRKFRRDKRHAASQRIVHEAAHGS